MTRALAVFAIAISVRTAGAADRGCTFDDTFANDVRAAATLGLSTMPLGKTHRIVVNPKTPAARDQITIEIVRSASCPDDAPHGVCVADAHASRIRCSAEELEALVKGDHRAGRASPALLYVITHELGHLQQGQTGTFQGRVALVHLGGSDQAKWRELRALCNEPDAATRKIEEGADASALVALERAADLDRYRDPLLSPQAAVYMFVERLRIASNALEEWESAAHPELAEPTAFVVQSLEPTPENIEQTSRRLLCQIRGTHSGVLAIPNAPDVHPDDPARLAAISVRLREKARALPGGPLARPAEVPDTRQLEILIPTIGAISATFDVKGKEFFDKLWPHLCEQYLNAEEWPDCSPAAFHDGTPECPLLLAIFDDADVAAAPAQVTLQATADGFRTEHGIAAIAPAGDRVLIALRQPNAIVEWSAPDRWTATSMPCEPRSVTATTSGYAVLCSNFDHVVRGAGGTLRHSKFHVARLNDRRIEPGKLEGTWIGAAGERLLATLSIPDDDRSMAVEITRDGARSLDAWRTEGCDKLRGGFALDREFGITISPLATLEVARFTSGFATLRDVLAPDELQADHDDLGAVIACGVRAATMACLDVRGTVFDPFAVDAPRSHVALSDRLMRSRVVHGRLAASNDGLDLVVWDAQGWELHRLGSDGHELAVLQEETATASADVVALPAATIVVVSDGTRSRFIRVAR